MADRIEISSYSIRKIILVQSKRAHIGHIGSCLSIADILLVLYRDVLQIKDPQDPGRDRFILSKGHAALALYACLYLKGWMSKKKLDSFCGDGSFLGVHPEHRLYGIDFSTGSLGHGLSVATGIALGAKMKGALYRSFVLMSDAEMNEGSSWEAAMFAAHHNLSNLILIIDENGQQATGYTKDVLNLEPLARRWEAFGWEAKEIDGHNVQQMNDVLKSKRRSDKPLVIIARTTFGKGVSFMENKIKWHYWPMSEQEYQIATEEIKGFLKS